MSFSTTQYLQMLETIERNRRIIRDNTQYLQMLETMQSHPAAEREVGHGGLQAQILDWCRGQWPRWKVIRARPDRASTIEVGAHDLTVMAPGGRVLLVECKSREGKLKPEQRNWARELEMLGHTVHVCRSLQEFIVLAVRGCRQKN